jgi:hypothetical protein
MPVRVAAWAGGYQRESLEQAGHEEQGDHRNAEAEPGQSELGEQGDGAFTGAAKVAANADDSVEAGIHEGPVVEAVADQRLFSLALRAMVGTVSVQIDELFGVRLDGAGERV